jgi:hypothetical protein
MPADARHGVYTIVAGMYAFSEDGTLQPLGEPVTIGQLDLSARAPVQAEPAGLSGL